ncbi:MAG: hypothetical protein ABIN96_14460 [Rubrivivax sp.]
MFNSEALEVGIGMAFLFLLMSLICTGVKEWIEGIFKWRAMDLERALRTLLDDEHGQLTAHLLSHPLISSLYRGSYDPSKLTSSVVGGHLVGVANAKHMALRARRNLPSYIPAGHFAKALIDLVARGPANVDSEHAPHAPFDIAQLRERAAALNSPFLRRAVLSAIDHCNGDLQQLTVNLQSWFDGSMDRASGWYKRRTQTVLFVLGIGAAAVLNVDALYVMGRLTADKAFRDAVVSAAAKAEAPAASVAGSAPDALAVARKARTELENIGMPMGWRKTDRATFGIAGVQLCNVEDARECNDSGYSYLRMVLGWLVTAFAVMLGSPFWFDILNKFMVIRSTVKPREKSREEGSEDRADSASKDAVAVLTPAPTATAALQAAQSVNPPTTPEPTPPLESPTPLQAFVPHQWRDGFVNSKQVPL